MMRAEWVDEDTVEAVLALMMPTNRLICRVCLATGLRVGDVVALRTARLHARTWVTEQKTGKRRRVYIRRRLLEEMRGQAGQIYIFEHRTDPARHRARQTVWADMKRAASRLGYSRGVSPHSLRKAWAVSALDRAGGDLEAVRRVMGHERVSTTMLYALSREMHERCQGRP